LLLLFVCWHFPSGTQVQGLYDAMVQYVLRRGTRSIRYNDVYIYIYIYIYCNIAETKAMIETKSKRKL
jgi:hypothetical protein